MKKYSLILMSAILVGIVFVGCNPLKKMKDNADVVKYNVNPQVLELVGEDVAFNVSGSYPGKYFNQNVIVTLTPVLKSGGSEQELEEYKVQGENVKDNHKEIKWETGGSFSHPGKISYNPEYQR